MNLEDRLNAAARETNRLAGQSTAPPIGSTERVRPWLAFSAALAVVIAIIGIPPLVANFGADPSSQGGPLAGPDATTTTQECIEVATTVVGEDGAVSTFPPTTLVGDSSDVEYIQAPDCVEPVSTTTSISATSTGVGFVCEASDYGPPTTIGLSGDDSDWRDLTEPVRDKLTRIAEAARNCDYNAIAALASEDITTSFGGGGVENIAIWHDEGVEVYAIINELFNMSHGVTEMDDGSRLYVWPAAFAHDSWDQIPEAEMTELLRLYTQDELDQLSQLGSYGGWRIGITESGDWIFFVAGD